MKPERRKFKIQQIELSLLDEASEFVYPSHWAISRSSQCSTTDVTKAVVCDILSVGWCI